MLFSAIILSSTTVIIGCLVVLITESLYNLLYNLPSAPPEMGGLLGQSKNTINTIFVDSGKISFRKSCQYVPNELLLNQTISDWDAQGIIFKGIFHTHKEGHGCQCLSSADQLWMLMWKSCIFRLLFLILEFSLISQFMINYPDFLLRPKNWIWHFNTIKRRKTLWTKTI